MLKIFRYFLALGLIFGWDLVANAQVRVWQGTLVLPTYEEGPPDPNPPFDQLTTNRFNYPYTLRTNLSDRRSNHNWRAVFLENEYLKCTVLPDLGGHLYTCVDKINGKPMFYANPSIKKANIGYRGAWAAFGVEYNFPVSHNWMSLSPIDFAFAQNADGSASVTVGNIDRVYGMEWSVELVLRPKSTVLEQRVRLYNRSDVRHRFYWWNNAAVEAWDDSHIEYPMRFAASHGFTEVQPWPVDSSGRDLSVIRNQTDGPVSLFVHGSREPFMGVWNPHTNSGTVHYADYASLPGKKIWSWGVDSDGLDWRRALSDNNSAYVEVQGGLFRNQETYAFLQPRQTIEFSEYWIPAREIGGITRANLRGVLALQREKGGKNLVVAFNANQAIPAAKVRVLDRNREIWSKSIDLLPERTFLERVPIAEAEQKYSVEIVDDRSAAVIRQTEEDYDWTPAKDVKVGLQETYKIGPPGDRTEDDWMQLGESQELNGNLLLALQTYGDLLKKNPHSYRGMKATGRLSVTLLHYEDAVKLLEPVFAKNTTDGEAAYYLGIAYAGLALDGKAREALEVAYRLPPWREAAALQLGELLGREHNLSEAKRFLMDALQTDSGDLRGFEESVAIKQTLGNSDAKAFAQQTLQKFPLSDFIREQLGTPDLQHLGNDDRRILNLAAESMRLGLYQNALNTLSRSYPTPAADQSEHGAPSPERDPMIAYYRAYCREKLGESSAADHRVAAELPIDYVFPSSAEDLSVLLTAVATSPNDANAYYLLGTLYFSKGLADQALGEWRRAQELKPKTPVLDASVGLALLNVKDDPEGALKAFSDGLRNDPRNEAVYLGADQTLSILQKPSSERVHVLDQYHDSVKMPSDLVFELAMNLAEMGEFDRASALFRDRFFPRQEGGTNVRQVWIEVQLLRVLLDAKGGRCDVAISTAERLSAPVPGISFTNDGMQPFLDSAHTSYELGLINLQCNQAGRAANLFSRAAAKTGAGEIVWAWLAARHVSGFNQEQWIAKLQSALQQADGMTETSAFAGWWVYNRAMLNRALGHEKEAEQDFRRVFLLPDRLLSYHLAREATTTQ